MKLVNLRSILPVTITMKRLIFIVYFFLIIQVFCFAQIQSYQRLNAELEGVLLAQIIGSGDSSSAMSVAKPGPGLEINYEYNFYQSFFAGLATGYYTLGTSKTERYWFVPFTVQGTWIPEYKNFEFPVTIGLGGAYSHYILGSLDPIIQIQIGGGYQLTPNMNLGLQLGTYTLLEELRKDSSLNRIGIFTNFGLYFSYSIGPRQRSESKK